MEFIFDPAGGMGVSPPVATTSTPYASVLRLVNTVAYGQWEAGHQAGLFQRQPMGIDESVGVGTNERRI